MDGVVIRTKGGTVAIDAINDTVNHYGAANVIDVQKVDSVHSYHEFGEVTKIMLEKGHFVAEASAKVVTLAITASSNSDVEISSKSSAEVFNLVSVNGLTGSEANIEVPASTVKVTEAKTAGEIEDIKYGGGSGISADPYLIYTSLNLMDVAAESNAGAYDVCIKIMSNIDMSGYNWVPFGNSGTPSNAFVGTINGNEKEIKNLQGDGSKALGSAYGLIAYAGHGVEVKDLSLADVNFSGKDEVGGIIGSCQNAHNYGEGTTTEITLTNCSVSGIINSTKRAAGLIAVAYGNKSATPYKRTFITATNCHVDAKLDSTSYRAGGLFGSCGDATTVTVETSSFKGSISATAGSSLGTGAIAAHTTSWVNHPNEEQLLDVKSFTLLEAAITAPISATGSVFFNNISLVGWVQNGTGNQNIPMNKTIAFTVSNGVYTYNGTNA